MSRSRSTEELEAEMSLPPRELTGEEAAFLRWILEHGSEDAKSFLPQLEGIRAIRGCKCGCPSLHFTVAENAPLGNTHEGRIICDLFGETARGETSSVILWNKSGKMDHLEISVCGDPVEPEFDLPLIESLHKLGQKSN